MIGFYDYTVVLTYLSLVSSIFGMTQVIDGHFRTAILCLALSGLLDMFDGKVARTKKIELPTRSFSVCRLILFAMLCVSEYFLHSSATF